LSLEIGIKGWSLGRFRYPKKILFLVENRKLRNRGQQPAVNVQASMQQVELCNVGWGRVVTGYLFIILGHIFSLQFCMQNLSKNRLLTLTLCFALSLSSVGLPVMIVACGMGTSVMTKSCFASCNEVGTSTRRLTRPPCRAQVYFIERNTNAYLPARTHVQLPDIQSILILPPCTLPAASISSVSPKPEASPPFIRENIPILISSLLI